MKISFVGDVFLGSYTSEMMKQYDITTMRKQLWGYMNSSDQIVINLEGPITEINEPQKITKVQNFKSSPNILNLFDNRFIFSLANNHIMDYGREGLNNTINFLKNKGFVYTGAGNNIDEACRPIVREINGIKIGYCFAADPRFNPADLNTPGTFPAKDTLLREILRELRPRVDIVIVGLHMGLMYVHVPSPLMISLSKLCISEKVDILQFHHSHNISGITKHNKSVIFWGSGNYVFTDRIAKGNNPWHESAIFQVELNINDKQIERKLFEPFLMNAHGIPELPPKPVKKKIERIIRKWSKRIENGKHLKLWRIIALMDPYYLIKFSLPNYIVMAKNEGILVVLRTMFSTVKLHFLAQNYNERLVHVKSKK